VCRLQPSTSLKSKCKLKCPVMQIRQYAPQMPYKGSIPASYRVRRSSTDGSIPALFQQRLGSVNWIECVGHAAANCQTVRLLARQPRGTAVRCLRGSEKRAPNPQQYTRLYSCQPAHARCMATPNSRLGCRSPGIKPRTAEDDDVTWSKTIHWNDSLLCYCCNRCTSRTACWVTE
jgi:hypothetical protein